jgi:GNAT superfamily N-acetyltransferase
LTQSRDRISIQPFDRDSDASALDAAARLLADRHRAQREVVPELDPRFEDPAETRREIEVILGQDRADGAFAIRGDDVVAYVIAAPRSDRWGPNMWVEGAGHAASEPEAIRDLYGYLAGRWVEAGAIRHSVIVPASDASLLDAWVRSGFGIQHTHGIRGPAAVGDVVEPRDGILLRPPERRDIPVLARLGLSLAEHQVNSPVFSMVELPTLEAEIADWEEGFDDPAYTTFVAEMAGTVVGAAIGCSIEVSSEHRGIVRPPNAGFLGFAAVLPEARGLGAGRMLGEAILVWARDAGYPTVVTDWRETNLLSSRAWPRLGFRPIFRRLHRAIA